MFTNFKNGRFSNPSVKGYLEKTLTPEFETDWFTRVNFEIFALDSKIEDVIMIGKISFKIIPSDYNLNNQCPYEMTEIMDADSWDLYNLAEGLGLIGEISDERILESLMLDDLIYLEDFYLIKGLNSKEINNCIVSNFQKLLSSLLNKEIHMISIICDNEKKIKFYENNGFELIDKDTNTMCKFFD